MKIVRKDFVLNGPGSVKMVPEEAGDLWTAYNLIAKGDSDVAVTVRKVLREAASGGRDAERIKLKLEIKVEIGAFHSLEIDLHRPFVLMKLAATLNILFRNNQRFLLYSSTYCRYRQNSSEESSFKETVTVCLPNNKFNHKRYQERCSSERALTTCRSSKLTINKQVARGLRPGNGILLRRWTLRHFRMQWSRFIWIMLVIWNLLQRALNLQILISQDTGIPFLRLSLEGGIHKLGLLNVNYCPDAGCSISTGCPDAGCSILTG